MRIDNDQTADLNGGYGVAGAQDYDDDDDDDPWAEMEQEQAEFEAGNNRDYD